MQNQTDSYEIFHTVLMMIGALICIAAIPAGAIFGYMLAIAAFFGGSFMLLLSGLILAIHSTGGAR
jgi:hypothetical protein